MNTTVKSIPHFGCGGKAAIEGWVIVIVLHMETAICFGSLPGTMPWLEEWPTQFQIGAWSG